jgi:hypothetical protein
LGFEHPATDEYVSFTAELPEDLSRLVGTGIDLDV